MSANATGLNVCSQALVIFAKYPAPGLVKTRLARIIGDTAACEIYRSFTDIIIGKAAVIKDVRIRLDIAPFTDESFSYFNKRYPNVDVVPQSGDDLGARMLNSITSAYSSGFERTCMIGTDIPDLPLEIINEAFKSLLQNDVVLGPSNDGGYYLIGMKIPIPQLFEDIAWSTDTVFSNTSSRAASLGFSLSVLPRFSDVDTMEDLAGLYVRIDCEPKTHSSLTELKNKIKTFLPNV